MKHIHLVFLFLLMFVCSQAIVAQEEDGDFSIKAQLRTRAEYRNGVLATKETCHHLLFQIVLVYQWGMTTSFCH